MSKKFLMGYDPELFWKEMGSNKIVSIIGKLGGTKDEARLVSPEGHGVLEDNVAAEFNGPPADSPEALKKHIRFMVGYLDQEARKQGFELARGVASVVMSDDQLKDDAAHVFGCEPDYNAWENGAVNPRPQCDNPNFRCAGGHIHIGTEEENKTYLVKKCDLFLGLPSVLMDKDTERRKLYGKPGAFRFKPYGVEYRTLSNFWIWEERTIDWAWEQTQRAIFSDIEESELDKAGPWIQHAIQNSDVELAKNLVAHYGLSVV